MMMTTKTTMLMMVVEAAGKFRIAAANQIQLQQQPRL